MNISLKRVVAAHMAAKKTKKVIRKKKVVESEYDLCPHCSSEIGEKALYQNEKGLFFHRVCGSPIEFPEQEKSSKTTVEMLTPALLKSLYANTTVEMLTPEQVKYREENLKNVGGGTFYFRVKTLGGPDNPHDFGECHPECEYLEWTPEKRGYCNLFKKELGKCRCSKGSGANRSKECLSAVEGLI